MAISFSRPDPSSPAAVSTANFSMSRRGFDAEEVREFLRMVAAELARLQEREKFLERELRSSNRSAPSPAVALDEEIITRMLGEEAARILTTAREAANQIKARAEEGASRLLREATDEAHRVREEAEIETARRRHDAAADAEAEIEMAKQQGRDMVNEARAYRERVLGELARRREMAREQIEQLVHGRDRLVNVFERARLAAADVLGELRPLDEPSEFVNLDPTTGPVPIMVPAQRRPVEPEPVAEVIEVVEPETVVESVAAVEVDEVVDEVEPEVVTEPEVAPEPEVIVADADVVRDDADDDRPLATVVALFAGEVDVPAKREAEVEPEAPKSSVDDLFARLRASRAESVVEKAVEAAAEAPAESPAAKAPVADTRAPTAKPSVFQPSVVAAADVSTDAAADAETPFTRRDAALTPLIVSGARKLKRVLADEQNDVLQTLRRKEAVRTVDQLVATSDTRLQQYLAAIHDELHGAAMAGAASIDSGTVAQHKKALDKHHALSAAGELLETDILAPLRERLDRAVSAADGGNDELADAVRAVFREWKTQRIDEHFDDVMRMAFGRGALSVLKPGTPVCWTVDPNGPDCADAEDNVLGGVVGAGEAFPTEHVCAPAHEGCRCMLQRAPR